MRKTISLLVLLLLSFSLLVGCSNNSARDGYCVTFHLNGALYQQTEEIRYYYPAKEGGTLILAPNDIISTETDKIVKEGYYIEGWYLSDEFKPDEKWDFSTDRLTADGLDLYANWKLDAVYKFAVVSNIDNEILGEYTVDEGETFSDYLGYANVDGYTFLEFVDESGNIINEDEYVHPGGDVDTTINIYANFLEGNYTVVKTVYDLTDAIRNETNIYLYNDIDCDGRTISFGDFNGRVLLGNGHTISNFAYDDNLSTAVDKVKNISLFTNVSDAVIQDVKFINGEISYSNFRQVEEINILPLAVSINNSTISNIQITYSLEVRGNEAINKTNEYENPYLNISNTTIENIVVNKLNDVR